MRANEFLIEDTQDGWFIGLRPTAETIERIVNWMDEQQIPNPNFNLHVTVILSREKQFDYKIDTFEPPLVANNETFKFDIFGDEGNVLVLKLNIPEIEKRHHIAREEFDIEWSFDEYIPHLTLTYELPEGFDLSVIDMPTFDLEFDKEYAEVFST